MTNEPKAIKTLRESEENLGRAINNLRALKGEVHQSITFLERLAQLGEAIRLAVAEQDKATEQVWNEDRRNSKD